MQAQGPDRAQAATTTVAAKARRSSHFTHLVERPVAEYPNEGNWWWGVGKKLHPCAHSKLLAANKPTTVGPLRAQTGSMIYGFDSFHVRILEVTSHPRLQ